MKWMQKLTGREIKHLQETQDGRPTLAALRRNREEQERLKAATGIEPCYDCRFIAEKLGIEKPVEEVAVTSKGPTP